MSTARQRGSGGSRCSSVLPDASTTMHGPSYRPGVFAPRDDPRPESTRPPSCRVRRGKPTAEGLIEAMARGTAIDVARRLELVGVEKPTLLSLPEAGEAGREVQTEERILRRNASRWHGEDRDSYKGSKLRQRKREERERKGRWQASRQRRAKRRSVGRNGGAHGTTRWKRS